jgi:PKD repeat protein
LLKSLIFIIISVFCLQLSPVQAAGQTNSSSFLNSFAKKGTNFLKASFAYSPTYLKAGQGVQFRDLSTGTPISWQWDFGDGTGSAQQNPTHVYASPGFRRVTLTVSNTASTRKASKTLTVLPTEAAASFVFSPPTPGPGQVVQFADTSTGNPVSWSWKFGDGGTSTVKNPSHAFARAGNYVVGLVATTSTGSKQASRTLTVASISVLNSSFAFAPTTPVVGQIVQFTDASAGDPTSWSWAFGDGATSTAQNPSHAYSTAGAKTVTLTVTNRTGSSTSNHALTVTTPLTASFSFSPTSPIAGQSVQFTDISSGNPASLSWNFGDGAVSSAQNPTHAYATAGTKTVTLIVTNSSGSNSTSRAVTVTAPLKASFASSPSSPVVNQPVQFTDASTGSPSIWQWTFGDGSTSSTQNPNHTYTAAGSYSVTLTIMTASGQDSVTQIVSVAAANSLVASFTCNPASPATGQAVQFTDTSTGGPTSWSWNFGDGSASTAQNPSHTYTAAGAKTVTLTATNSSGSTSVSKTVTIVAALAASFAYSPASPVTGQAVQFTDTSTGGPTSWNWNFGDGSASTAQNPSHTYTAAGAKTVTLTATSGSGSASVSKTINVAAVLASSFIFSPSSPTIGQTVQFTDTSTGNPTAWNWAFGDGSTSTAQNPSHVYTVIGTYDTVLTILSGSDSNSKSVTIVVGAAGTMYSLPLERTVNWSQAGVWYGGVKGIPSFAISRNVKDAPYNAVGDGSHDDTSAIQSAINSCASGSAVYLPSGTYKITSSLRLRSGVVIRGDGSPTTKIVNYSNGDAIVISGEVQYGPSTNITSGSTKGSSSIVVSSASSFPVGSLVVVDQLNDAALTNSSGGEGNCDWCSRDNGARSLGEIAVITAKSGNTLTLSHPLLYGYNKTPQIYLFCQAPIVNAGVENLYIKTSSSGLADACGVDMIVAYGCWVKNVEFDKIPRKCVWVQASTGCEVRKSYFHDATQLDGDHGYAISTQSQSSLCLYEDNIFYNMHANIAFGSGGGVGNVAAYNYGYNCIHEQPSWFIHSFATHGAHTYMNLWEGNVMPKIGFDNIWGSGSHQVVFRNQIRDSNPGVTVTTNLAGIQIAPYNRYDSFVGNVLGYAGYTGTYNYASDGSYCLWQIDTSDPLVKSTLIRHGNYDYADLETKWDAGSANHTLASSLYLVSRPSWFGSVVWPPFGPDVSGYVQKIPAQIRFETGPGHYFD